MHHSTDMCIFRVKSVIKYYIKQESFVHTHSKNTTNIPQIYHKYTTNIPQIYHKYTASIPQIYHTYTTNIPQSTTEVLQSSTKM